MPVLRTKTVEQSIEDTEQPGQGLRRALGPVQLTMIGIGVIIGTGIFVLTGEAAGITSVILVLLMGQSRVFFAMSRDRLLPPVFSAVSERFGTPYRTTIVTGIAVAALTFFLSLKTLAELVNIGTLFAFVLVAIAVIILRRSRPDLGRPFRTPLVPVLPILSVLASLWLMLNLQSSTWIRFGVWLAVGLVVYFGYSVRHSRLAGRDRDRRAARRRERQPVGAAPG
jgi:APA family basic amino acid/polyamine antiporter